MNPFCSFYSDFDTDRHSRFLLSAIAVQIQTKQLRIASIHVAISEIRMRVSSGSLLRRNAQSKLACTPFTTHTTSSVRSMEGSSRACAVSEVRATQSPVRMDMLSYYVAVNGLQ